MKIRLDKVGGTQTHVYHYWSTPKRLKQKWPISLHPAPAPQKCTNVLAWWARAFDSGRKGPGCDSRKRPENLAIAFPHGNNYCDYLFPYTTKPFQNLIYSKRNLERKMTDMLFVPSSVKSWDLHCSSRHMVITVNVFKNVFNIGAPWILTYLPTLINHRCNWRKMGSRLSLIQWAHRLL